MRFISFAIGAVLVGCGGTSFIGSGEDAGAGTGGMAGTAGKGGSAGKGSGGAAGSMGGAAGSTGGAAGMGGMGAGGSGGTGASCAGVRCGTPCNLPCPAGMICPAVSGFCNESGVCDTLVPECPITQCNTPMDCPPTGLPCQMCVGGGSACPFTTCIEGRCGVGYPLCETTPTCTSDTECPVTGACQACADGRMVCPTAQCLDGMCVSEPASCYQPCAGKRCGDGCLPCDPADPTCVAPDVVMQCDQAGACVAGMPLCATCETGLCARPYRCVRACGQMPEYVGCCQCESPLFDDVICMDE